MAPIQRLPQAVVDRIAAGEVVQNPASAVKELLENAIDAGANAIVVGVEVPSKGGGFSLSIADNGCGMDPTDLPLAAQRHATSKLSSLEDFDTLSSLGFRGEALASMSLVAKLSLITRTARAKVAHEQHYLNGEAVGMVKPRARRPGTTVKVEDLFYNLGHRRRSMTPATEYQRLLAVVQKYAIHHAGDGITMVVEKKTSSSLSQVDFNTGALSSVKSLQTNDKTPSAQTTATMDAMVAVYGSSLAKDLREFKCEHKGTTADDCQYTCRGLVTTPSQANTSRTTLVLFVNHRLVECPRIKRTLEDAYGEHTKSKPVAYLSLMVPPTHVDVNVHPSKQQIALLHLDALCHNLGQQMRAFWSDLGQSFAVVTNPYTKKRKASDEAPSDSQSALSSQPKQPPLAPPKKPPPSRLIRTDRSIQAGALEPFLVPTQKSPATQASTQSSAPSLMPTTPSESGPAVSSATESTVPSKSPKEHEPDCPLAPSASPVATAVDLTQPGAFAMVASQSLCTCAAKAVVVRLPRTAVARPPVKVTPTPCRYQSIQQLRKRVEKRACVDTQKRLRGACHVGTVSTHRSLLQCGEELVLLNHYAAAKELFYQLALWRFGGGAEASRLGSVDLAGIDIQSVMEQTLQLEELLQTKQDTESLPEILPVSETTTVLAEQATACLWQKAEMLSEYFAIVISKDDYQRILLQGLPVLLEGYAPSPHGLGVFLLRLATEVDWSEERPCFHDVCTELAAYYAELPASGDLHATVRHQLFPAISSLLVPSQRMEKDDSMTVLTTLSQLYKVFERC